MLENFEGTKYLLSDNWFSVLDVNEYKNKPIRYLEIGAFYGANLISVSKTYGSHPQSELHCIDPWEDYQEYVEYKTQQPKIYETFLKNINSCEAKDRIKIHRGYSHEKIHDFENDYFDIIYIDGNHDSDYVLEDAVLSFRKLKVGGVMIFDDYGYGPNPHELVERGVNAFLSAYQNRIKFHNQSIFSQVFVWKIK